MAISTMYPAKAGSPKTQLTAELSAVATSMTVSDASVLPAAPNLAVLGDDSDAEVISYTGKSGNTITGLVRGLGGTTASVWPDGTDVARNYTSFDHDRFIENIEDLETNKLDSVSWGDIGGDIDEQTDLQSALALKANLTSPSFTGAPTAPTPASGDNDTNIATTAFVQGELAKQIRYYKRSVSTGTGVQILRIPAGSDVDNTINTSTVVLELSFDNPNNITSSVAWESFAGYIAFTGTCTAVTNANVIIGQKGN